MSEIRVRLTVGDLRKAIADLPDDALVLVDYQTEHDGYAVEKQGTATWCGVIEWAVPHRRIDATDEFRDSM